MICEWCGRMSSKDAAALAARLEFWEGAHVSLFDGNGQCFLSQAFTEDDIKAGRIVVPFSKRTDVRAAVLVTARGQTIPVDYHGPTIFLAGSTYAIDFDRSVNDR